MADNNPVYWAFTHFYHTDYANAAIHQARVRFSPITFDLADWLYVQGSRNGDVLVVMTDKGAYELDKGR